MRSHFRTWRTSPLNHLYTLSRCFTPSLCSLTTIFSLKSTWKKKKSSRGTQSRWQILTLVLGRTLCSKTFWQQAMGSLRGQVPTSDLSHSRSVTVLQWSSPTSTQTPPDRAGNVTKAARDSTLLCVAAGTNSREQTLTRLCCQISTNLLETDRY